MIPLMDGSPNDGEISPPRVRKGETCPAGLGRGNMFKLG